MKSAFLGMVRPNRVACSDIIQCWLDVSNHESRGTEQADFIWKRQLCDALPMSPSIQPRALLATSRKRSQLPNSVKP